MSEKISIQVLMEEIEHLTADMNRGELCAVIKGLAEKSPVRNREQFLNELQNVAGHLGDEPDAEELLDTVFADCDEVRDQLDLILDEAKERSELIENGDYSEFEDWDGGNGYEEWGYHDEDYPDVLSEDHEATLNDIRVEADDALLDGGYAHALAIYKGLIEFEKELKASCAVVIIDVCDQRMAVNYCRCVCKQADIKEQATVLYEACLFIAGALQFKRRDLDGRGVVPVNEIRPLIDDWEGFKRQLKQNNNAVAGQLYIEALADEGNWDEAWSWLKRAKGLRAAVAGSLLHELDEAGEWKLLVDAARYAMKLDDADDSNPHIRLRVIAELLIKAGRELNDQSAIAAGIRAEFEQNKDKDHVIRLYTLLKDWERLPHELTSYRELVQLGQSKALILVLLGEFQELLRLCAKTSKCYGWSRTEAEPIAVACALISLCRNSDTLPTQVESFAQRYICDYDSTHEFIDDLTRIIQGSVASAPNERDSFMWRWTHDLLIKRAEFIVNKKFRGAYDRAAEGIVAWAECARLNGRTEDATRIVGDMHKEFPRHSAFRRELKARV